MLKLPKLYFNLSGDNKFIPDPALEIPKRHNLRALINMLAPTPSASIKKLSYKDAVGFIFSDLPFIDDEDLATCYGQIALYLLEQLPRVMSLSQRSKEPMGYEYSSYITLNSRVTENFDTWAKFNLHWSAQSKAKYLQGQRITTSFEIELVPVEYQVSFWIDNKTNEVRYTNWGFIPDAPDLHSELEYLQSRLYPGHNQLKERLEPLNDTAKVRFLSQYLLAHNDDIIHDAKRGIIEGYTLGVTDDNESSPPTLTFKVKRRHYDKETELSLLFELEDIEI